MTAQASPADPAAATARANPLRFALEGDRVRRAAAALERIAPRLEAALRRGVPFISRRAIPVALTSVRALPLADALRELTAPWHLARLTVAPGGATGALAFDAHAVSLLLDGVLGGDGADPPTLEPAGLSAPQTALMARVCDGIIVAFGEALATRLGIRIALRAGGGHGDPSHGGEGAPLACTFTVGEGPRAARVMLLLPKEAVLAGAFAAENAGAGALPAPPLSSAPRIIAAVEQVQLELVVELGRPMLALGRLARLRVGDVIELDVAVTDPVVVRVDGHVLLRGRPTTLGGRIAIKIEERHER